MKNKVQELGFEQLAAVNGGAGENTEYPCICDICGQSFGNFTALAVHRHAEHTGLSDGSSGTGKGKFTRVEN